MKPSPRGAAPLPPGAVMPPMTTADGSMGQAASGIPADQARLERPPRTKPAQTNPTKRAHARDPRPKASSTDRFQSINDFVDVTMRSLSDRAAKAWLVLWRDTKPNGLARTAISDLARRMGCSTATAKRAVAELKKLDLLEIEARGGLGRGPSSYRLVRN